MAQESNTFVDNVDLSKCSVLGEVMSIFIRVARYFPDQVSALFEKYVAYYDKCNNCGERQSREAVKWRINFYIRQYAWDDGTKTVDLLHKVYGNLIR